MRRTAIAVCAVLLAMSLVSPALGGPSIGSVAKQAKKALKAAKKAKRSAASAKRTANSARNTANSARNTANSAQTTATAANSKADQALSRPVVTAGGITTVTSGAEIPAGSFEITAAVCPTGQRAISGGVVSISGQGGVWAHHASEDRTAWIGGGEDLAGTGGNLTVSAYCVPAGQATIARRVNRAAVNAEVAAERQAKASFR
jgi:Alanine-zipper, major outer membrane lipoprotein